MSDEVIYEVVDPFDADALAAVGKYFVELDARFPGGFDGGLGAEAAGAEAYRPPDGAFVLARHDGMAIGCGALQTIGDGIGEIKRMWVDTSMRGRGFGAGLLGALERLSAEFGHTVVRLDTNENLPEAIAMYERAGYRPIERYNDNPYPTHFFEKRVGEGT